MIIWSAGHNIPGYLPEGDPVAFENRLDAMRHTVEELRNAAERLYELLPDHPSAGEFGEDYDRAANALEGRDAEGGDWYETFEDGRIAYWFQSVDLPDDEARAFLAQED